MSVTAQQRVKLVLLGEQGVGKSWIFISYDAGRYPECKNTFI